MITRVHVLVVRGVSVAVALLGAGATALSLVEGDARSAVLAGVVGPVCAAGFWRVAQLLDRVRRDFDKAGCHTDGAS